jgi:hypothetical protein
MTYPPSNCWPMIGESAPGPSRPQGPAPAIGGPLVQRDLPAEQGPTLPFEAAKQLSPSDPPREIEPLVAESNSQNGGN